MDSRFPDLPTVPIPAAKPVRKRQRSWLLVVLIGGAIVVLGCGIFLTTKMGEGPAGSQAHNAPQASGTLAPTATGQATNPGTTPSATLTQSTGTVTAGHQPGSTPTPPLSSISHGRPRLGGPFSDFVGKYGPATQQGDANSQNFWTGPNQTIDINAIKNEQGNVMQLTILGSNTWDISQTTSYCTLFLPDNAVAFHTTSTLINYHTSAGDVTLTLQATSCALSFAKA